MNAGDARPAPRFAYRKAISLIPPTSTDLVDYPAAIIVPPDPQLAMHVIEQDLWFSAADGTTALPYEIERFDPATGNLHAWVRIPLLAGGVPTEIYLHYGEVIGDRPAANNPFTVWPDAYAAVWHLTGDPARSGDSTGKGHELVQSNPALQPKIASGLVGQGRAFDGAPTLTDADRMRASDQPDLDPALDQSFSYACWVKVGTPADEYDMPLHKGGASALQAGYDFELGHFEWMAQVSDGSGTNVNRIIIPAADATALRGSWAHLVTVIDRDRDEMALYVNGNPVGSTELTENNLASTSDLSLSMPGDDLRNRFAGEIDEVRIVHRALEGAWILTEYRNLAFPETFLEIGSEEPLR